MTNNTELLACPFCGNDELTAEPETTYVMCHGCDADGPVTKPGGAITAWNTRASPAEDVRAVVEEPLDPVHGDVLPPIGSKVWIELASSGWDEQTVTGYYVWPNHGLDKNVHRVFVRVKDAEGTPNARLLADVRTSAPATPQ